MTIEMPPLESQHTLLIESILMFWFGRIPNTNFGLKELRLSATRLPYWGGHFFDIFHKADDDIRQRFLRDVEKASAGEYDSWTTHPLGRLALIILLDQFPRNIHRGTVQAFANDKKVLALAFQALENKDDHLFDSVIKHFIYLPLMHKEDLATQDQCVALYKQAIKDANYLAKPILAMETLGASRHRYIIKRFGRFPHRNKILERESTPQETCFLRQPFSTF